MFHCWLNPYRILCIVIFACAFAASAPAQAAENLQASGLAPQIPSALEAKAAQLSYVSAGHALGFRSEGVLVAARDHALRVEFDDANLVMPVSASRAAQPESTQATKLEGVTYPNLWPGITLQYDMPADGILRSTYTLESYASVGQIHLRYNAPISINDSGQIVIAYDTGRMTESAPVAWQMIDGAKTDVSVSFVQYNDHVAGFTLGAHDPRFPLTIDPTLGWNTFFGGTLDDMGTGVAVDGSGNVYVTGFSRGGYEDSIRAYSARYDGFVVKLNSSGVPQWNTFLGGTEDDYGWGITTDSNGNVYVVGESHAAWGTATRPYSDLYDAFVVKMDSNGGITWLSFVGGNSFDIGHGITVDGSGNIYVTGQSSGTWGTSPKRNFTASNDAFAAKLDSSGALVWNTFLGGIGYDQGEAIVIDGNSYAYVVGQSDASWYAPTRAFWGTSDGFAAMLKPDGDLVWNTFLGGSTDDDADSAAVDSGGNLYVTGYSGRTWETPINAFAGFIDAYVVKVDHNGNLVWNTFLGSSGIERGQGLAMTANGKIWVTGVGNKTWGSPVRPYSGDDDIFVVQLSAAGAVNWSTFLGGTEGDNAKAIRVDGNENSYITGFSRGAWGTPTASYGGGADPVVAKLNSSGGLTWNAFSGQGGSDTANAVTTDYSGNILIAGTSSADWGGWGTHHSRNDAYAAKLDPAGHLLWSNHIGGEGDDAGYGIGADVAGNIYVVGTSNLSWGSPVAAYTAGNDAFVAKLLPNGPLSWNTFLGGSSHDNGTSIAVTADGIVFVGGYSDATWGSPVYSFTGGTDGFVTRLTTNGGHTWHTFIGGLGIDHVHAIALDSDNNVYLAGYSTAAWGSPVRNFTSNIDALAAKLNANGGYVWHTYLGGFGIDIANGIGLDANNNVYLAGISSNTWGTPERAYTASFDAFVVKLSNSGTYLWNTFLGGNGLDAGSSILVSPSGATTVGGTSDAAWGTSAFRPYSAAHDAYAARLDSVGHLIWHGFAGGMGDDYGLAVSLDQAGSVILVGYSDRSWGSPINAYSANTDIFVTKFLMKALFLPVISR